MPATHDLSKNPIQAYHGSSPPPLFPPECSVSLVSLAAVALASFSTPMQAAPQEPAMDTLHLVRVELDAEGHDLAKLASFGLDVTHSHLDIPHLPGSDPRAAEVVLDDQQIRDLRAGGWRTQLLIEDLQEHYATRLQQSSTTALGPPAYGAWLNPPYASGAMSGYYGYAQIGSVLDQIHAAYPNITGPKTSIGQTLQGRDIWVLKVSDNPGVDEAEPEVRFDSMHHAREPQSMQTSLWFLLWLVESYGSDPLATYIVNERELFILPCVNPDGYMYNQQQSPSGGGLWRKNRRNNGGGIFGVDLNRNYDFQWGFDNSGSSTDPNSETYRGPSAASEPTVQVMQAFIASRDFKTVLTLHSYGDVWLSPLGYAASQPTNQAQYDEVGSLATEISGHPYGPASILLYLANGTTLDYDHGVNGSLTWTPELGGSGDGFWPATDRIIPIAEQNRIGLARTALAAGEYLRLLQPGLAELIGDGDGNFEGGETVAIAVEVRNSGLGASNPAQVTLSSSSSALQVLNGSTTLASVGPFSTGTPSSTPTLRIVPGTPAGSYPFEVELTQGGLSETVQGEVSVGMEVTLYAYDFEAAGNQGWGVGSPNDASTGNWTRVNPNGTDAQSEDDHTPGAGNVQCWVTGQGSNGGSVGENDVDGGTTSLTSPVFDLAGMQAVTINYWRWYSTNFSSGTPDDALLTDLSNDGGSNWTTIETLGPTGPGTTGGWIEKSFDPAEYLPLTDLMRLRIRASDLGDGSIVEAGLDDFSITTLMDGDCPPAVSYCNTSPNSVGSGAIIATSGSSGVSDQSFGLAASGVPAGNFGLFFYGAGQASGALGQGTLCIAPPFTRFVPLQADGSGVAAQAVLLAAPLNAGSSWNFQFWYRDPAGGGSGFNLSDALNVTFCN